MTDRTIRAAIAEGAHDVDAVSRACGAGQACGGCVPTIEELLAQARMALSDPTSLRALQQWRRGLAGHATPVRHTV